LSDRRCTGESREAADTIPVSSQRSSTLSITSSARFPYNPVSIGEPPRGPRHLDGREYRAYDQLRVIDRVEKRRSLAFGQDELDEGGGVEVDDHSVAALLVQGF
jgi:hypothetical protein